MTTQFAYSEPDTVLHNATFYTVDPLNPWAQAVAIANGRITAIGDDDDLLSLAGRHTRVVDLGGRFALPGFCDSHIHFYNWSLTQSGVLLAATRSKAEMLHLIAERAAVSEDDAWIMGRGWNESWWGDTEYPTAADLDTVTGPRRPALFYRTDMHAVVANSRALELAHITAATPDPEEGVIVRDEHGVPTGVLKEHAIGLVDTLVPLPTPAEAVDAIRNGIALLHQIGVTAVHDQRMGDHDDGPRALAAYQALNVAGELRLRTNCNVAANQLPALHELGLSYGFGDDNLRLGHVKLFADGSLGSQTALMLEPFLRTSPVEPENTGVRIHESDELVEIFRSAAAQGFPISIHAIGDRANHDVLDVFEELQQSTPVPPAPHRIEHVQILDPDDVPRLGALGITASVQPVHIIDDIAIADRILGGRGAHMYNFQSLRSSGALLAFGSDAPVADPNPFLGIHSALYRRQPDQMDKGPWYPNEAISLEEAIYAYTMGPARATGWQQAIGSIELGKRADIIALDRNLFEMAESSTAAAGSPATGIADTNVELVVFDGEIVHEAL